MQVHCDKEGTETKIKLLQLVHCVPPLMFLGVLSVIPYIRGVRPELLGAGILVVDWKHKGLWPSRAEVYSDCP